PPRLMRSLPDETTLDLTTDGPADEGVLHSLATLAGVQRVERLQSGAETDGAFPNAETPAADAAGNRVRLYVTSDAASLVAPAASLLAARGLELGAVKLGSPTLEAVFIHLTGSTLR